MSHVIAIVGPTAIGKSHLSVELATAFNGEVVSADSRQIYRYMDIGTAKPDREQQRRVPHHLVDIINPDEDFNLAQFQQMAGEAIEDIRRRGKLPLVVGGSGQYVRALLEGWEVPQIAPDRELRKKLEQRAAAGESEGLYAELVAREPEYASRIDGRNMRRVIRALEVSQIQDSPVRRRSKPPYEELIIGLTADRQEVYRRIDRRVDEMMERGLMGEVKGLVSRGYDYSLPSMSAIGYRQIGAYLRREIPLEEAVRQIKYESHRFARQQYNWFKLEDSRIKWFNIEDVGTPAAIRSLVKGFIDKNDD